MCHKGHELISCISLCNTVKLAYKDHPMHQQNMVFYTQVFFMCRFNNMENISLGTCKMWSLKAGGLYIQVVFRAGWTVIIIYCNDKRYNA